MLSKHGELSKGGEKALVTQLINMYLSAGTKSSNERPQVPPKY